MTTETDHVDRSIHTPLTPLGFKSPDHLRVITFGCRLKPFQACLRIASEVDELREAFLSNKKAGLGTASPEVWPSV
jgi:hypothetical protein